MKPGGGGRFQVCSGDDVTASKNFGSLLGVSCTNTSTVRSISLLSLVRSELILLFLLTIVLDGGFTLITASISLLGVIVVSSSFNEHSSQVHGPSAPL